ncbi:MAG: hypothetical protein U1A78_27440 [Polyangia bacterium]
MARPLVRSSQLEAGDPVASSSRPPPSLSPSGARVAWLGLLGLAAVLHLASLGCALELHARLRAQIGLSVAAGLCWLAALAVVRRSPPPERPAERRLTVGLLLLALVLRLPALLPPLGHSDDVFRYLWDGAVQAAGHSPYQGPPDDPAYAAVAAAHPSLHARINHRHLPTIYPPVAQAVFRAFVATAGLPPDPEDAARRWRLFVGGLDLTVLALLWPVCRRRDLRLWAVWAACPLPAMELWLNGHIEGLGLLPLVLGLLLWRRAETSVLSAPSSVRRPSSALLAGAVTALAVLVKPVALAPLPSLVRLGARARAALLLGLLLGGSVGLWPYRGAGGAMLGSLGEYGRRWRSNDGAYALVYAAAASLVDAAYQPPYYEPWRSKRLARLISGRARDTVWPDELTAALARGTVAAALLALALWLARRGAPAAESALLLLLGYQLLTPTLHPWYELWPLAVLVLAPSGPRLLWALGGMVALAPLGYLPLGEYWQGAPWREARWPRLLEHGAGWLGLLWACRARFSPRSLRAAWPRRARADPPDRAEPTGGRAD